MTARRSIRCTADSIRSGEQCRRRATAGAKVCCMHGARAPQVALKATLRVTLQEALANGDHRPAGVILLDALATCDHLMREAKLKVVEGELTPDALDAMVAATSRAAAMARIVVDAGVEEQQHKAQAEEVEFWVGVLDKVRELWPGFPSPGPAQSRDERTGEARAFRKLVGEVIRHHAGSGPPPSPPVLVDRFAIEAAPRPAEEPVAASAPPAAPVDDEAVVVVEPPSRAARPGNVEDAEPVDVGPVRAFASVGRAIVSRCPGCGEAVERNHDQLCGWSTVSARAGSGFAR